MEKESGYLIFVLACFAAVHSSALAFAVTFDNLTTLGTRDAERSEIINDLRMAINDSSDDIENNMAIRYPEFLSVATKMILKLRNFTSLNEKEICSEAKSMMLKSADLCTSKSNDFGSPCYWSKWKKMFLSYMMKNGSMICASNEKNITINEKFVRRRKVPATYLLLAVKILARAAILNHQRRRCSQLGGTFQDGIICTFDAATADTNVSDMDFAIDFDEVNNESLFIVSISGNITSLLCLILLLVTYILLQKYKSVPGKNTMCLSSSLVIANILQIIVGYHIENETMCIVAGVLLHWSFLAAFFWMSALAYDYFITFHKIRLVSDAAKNSRFRAYCLISFITPTVAVSVCLALDIPNKKITQYGNNGKCFVAGFWTNLFAFVLPVAVILAVNIALLIFTVRDVRLLRRSASHLGQAANRKNIVLTLLAMKISVIVGIAWIMAFIDGFVSNLAVRYIYTIIVTFQGFFIYIAFGSFELVLQLLKDKMSQRSEVSARISTKETKM